MDLRWLQRGSGWHQSGYETIVEVAWDRWRRIKNALWQEAIIRITLKDFQMIQRKSCRFIGDVLQKWHFRQCRKKTPRRSWVASWWSRDGNMTISECAFVRWHRTKIDFGRKHATEQLWKDLEALGRAMWWSRATGKSAISGCQNNRRHRGKSTSEK